MSLFTQRELDQIHRDLVDLIEIAKRHVPPKTDDAARMHKAAGRLVLQLCGREIERGLRK